ncbi:MAG: ABC transporter ATP-binding protein [Clostridia bacterium]|nr:ABC transporter ATP-binding protein [Clostridia bacterium]
MVFGKHINRYYVKYAPQLLLGILALIVIDYFQLRTPDLYAMLLDGANNGFVVVDGVERAFDMTLVLDEILLPMLVIILVMLVGRFVWRICFFGASIKVSTDLRRRMFGRCKNLSQQYYQVNKVGNLMSYFINDIETIDECFGDGVLMMADAIALGGLALYKMAVMNIWLTLLALVPMALLLLVSTVVGKYMMKKWDARQEAFSALSDFSQESFSGIAVVKAFVKEFKELWAFKKLSKNNENANIEFTRASTLLHISVTLFVESVVCIIFGYGGYLVHEGTFTSGQLFAFSGYFTSTVWPIMAISQLIDMNARGKASLKRIGDLLDAKIDVDDRADVAPLDSLRGDIEFRGLTFRYPDGDYDALSDVSFKINAGENVGIIGKTGSGKTTLVDLILRIYNVPDGTLFVDGHDVNTVPIDNLRSFCAYVPQDNFLFSDTIENNIAFATDGGNIDGVINAARLADVHGNISEFKDGYSTVLGERGVTVSGGQKQRISIARALMKNAPILILDDSVSAVDTNTERVIIGNLRESRRGKTTILIAHRVSTIENMDKIIYLDDGRVAAVGTHEELLAASEDYRNMVELQRLEDEKGGNS